MKRIFILLGLLAFFACEKETNEDSIYTNLNGTVLEIDPVTEQGTNYAEHSLSLDIDKDNIEDVTFTVITRLQRFGPSYGYNGIEIKPLNGFKVDTMLYSVTETSDLGNTNVLLVIPRIYNNGDTIENRNTYYEGTIKVADYTYSGYYHDILSNDKWINIGTKYIVLKKEGSINTEYCWIKVNVTTSNSIKLISCFYSKDITMRRIIDIY
jgi:hypothetical protein